MRRSGWLCPNRKRRTGEALALAVLLSAPCVCAEPHDAKAHSTSESGQADAEQAVKELMRRGVAEYRKGHLEAARAAFARAFELKQHAAIAATLAEVETKLELYRPAATHWAFYLEHLPPERESERREVEAALAECRRHLGTIGVEVDARTAKVTLDDEPIVPSPVEKIWVEPGEHTLAAESEQGADRIVISVAAGESKTAVLHTLTPASSDPAHPEAFSTPQPPDATRASSSERQRLENANSGARTAVLISGSAAAAAAAIVGTTFTALAIRAGNSAHQIERQLDEAAAVNMLPPSGICAPAAAPPIGCSELTQKQAEQRRNKNIAIGSFITAGGLAALTVGAYLLWPSASETRTSVRPKAWTFVPWFTATGAGIELCVSQDWIVP